MKMRITYYKDVDLLDVEFSSAPRAETRDVGPHAWGEFDADERLVGITFQHASTYIDIGGLPSGLVEEGEEGAVSMTELEDRMKRAG